MSRYTTTHVCPNCGRRIKCDRPLQPTTEFEAKYPAAALVNDGAHIELSESSAWPTIRYEVYWGIRHIADPFYKALAVWIPINAIAYGIFGYLDAPVFITVAFNIGTLAACMSAFGKVPDWHNMVEDSPPAKVEQELQEPEDTRQYVGWETTEQTKTTMHMEWYTPPCPIPQAQSYALALVNRRFEWVDERSLREYKAVISQTNYRKLRLDWIGRGWCEEYGKKTIVTNKRMILKVAFDKPE